MHAGQPRIPAVRPPQTPQSRQPAARATAVQEGRSDAEFARARKHTARVRFFKWALPAGGIVAIVALVVSFFLLRPEMPGVDLTSVRLEDGRLVMDNPKLSGVDAKSRPFELSADRALQDTENPTLITMEKLRASLPVADTQTAEILADHGMYDADQKTLRLDGGISVDTSDGMSARLQDADIDIDSGLMQTAAGITIDTGRIQLTAKSMTISDNGQSIVFSDGVRLTILPFGDSPTEPTTVLRGSKE